MFEVEFSYGTATIRDVAKTAIEMKGKSWDTFAVRSGFGYIDLDTFMTQESFNRIGTMTIQKVVCYRKVQPKICGTPMAVRFKNIGDGCFQSGVYPVYGSLTMKQFKEVMVQTGNGMSGASDIVNFFSKEYGKLDSKFNSKHVKTLISEGETIIVAKSSINVVEGGGSPIFCDNPWMPKDADFGLLDVSSSSSSDTADESGEHGIGEILDAFRNLPAGSDAPPNPFVAFSGKAMRLGENTPKNEEIEPEVEGKDEVVIFEKVKRVVKLNKKNASSRGVVAVLMKTEKATVRFEYFYPKSATFETLVQKIEATEEGQNVRDMLLNYGASTLPLYESIFSLMPIDHPLELVPKMSAGGSAVKKQPKKKKDERLMVIKAKCSSIVNENLIDQQARQSQAKAIEIINHPSTDLVIQAISTADATTINEMKTTWDEGSVSGERFASEFAPHFIPQLATLNTMLNDLEKARDMLVSSFEVKFAEEFMTPNGQYKLAVIGEAIEARVKEIEKQEQIESEVARRVAQMTVAQTAPTASETPVGMNLSDVSMT